MANFDQLKQSVAALIRTNGAEEITGQIMQDVLLTIINSISGGYMFGGVAQHNGNVGNPDYNVFYLAGSGAYTGYGGAITIEAGCYGVFRYNGTWTQEVVDIGVRLSGSIAPGETRGVTGDVINTALQTLFNNVMNILDTLTFTYNTPSAQQATKAMLDVIVTPTGGASHVLTTLTLASATVAAAGLMSAEDKQKVDRMLTDFRSLSLSDTTAAADQATKIVQTLSATLGENPEAITTFTLLAATASKAGLMSATDKSYLDGLPAVITGINGAISDNLARVLAMMGYYECDTAAGTAAKTVSASGYVLTNGGCIRIKMTNANTADNVTLNINSTGAKALYYDGAQASSSNTWEAGEVLEVYYDGTQYQCASGGGGKFATGQKVKETSIIDEIVTNSIALPTSGAVAGVTDSINERVQTIITEIGITLQLKPSDFVTGTLDPGAGTETSRTDRIRSGFIQVNVGDVVTYTLNGQDILFYYYDTNKVYVSNDASWTETSGSIEIAQDGYIRVLVRIADGTPITPSELAAVITITNPNSVIGAIEQNTSDIEDLQADVGSLKQELFDINELTSSDFEQGTLDPQSGGLYPTFNAARIRTIDFVSVAKNTTLTITPHSGQYWIIYYYTTDGGYVSSTSWTNTPFIQTFDNPAMLKFLVRKSVNNAEILPSELDVKFVMKTPKLEALSMEIDSVSNDVQDLAVEVRNISKNSSDAPLFLGTLLQRTSTGTADTKRVSTQGQMVVPFVGAKIKLKLPPHYYVGIRSGATSSNIGYNDYWYGDGYEYQFREDANYFCLSFCHAPNDSFSSSAIVAITPEEVQALIDSGDISITVELNDASTVVARNFECEKYAKAIMRPFVSGSENNGSLSKLPIFSHISDLHGDAKRFMQFMEYSDHIGVDAALITGDMVAMDYRSGKAYVDDIAQEYITPDLQCLGNHECLHSVATPVTENEMLARCIEKNQCTVNSSETYPTYYYKDIAAKNIRIIALNLYDGGSGNAEWRLSQVQAQWLVTVLAATPANYGVILMAHSPEDIPPVDSSYGLFRQPILNYTTTGSFATKPLRNIIDSFIGKTAATVTYTLDSQEITISTDFTSLNAGVEFIAYVNGHLHSDTIGYIPNATYRQLCLNVNCGIAVYGPNNYPWYANGSDLPRGGEGVTQDCFNIYAIDRQSGTVRVAKIGSHITGDMIDRNFIVLPYKD